MRREPVPYQKIVFVCVNRRPAPKDCCAERGGEALAEALKDRIKTLGLSAVVRVSKSGCHDLCARGASVMVFPDYTWYSEVTAERLDEIVREITRGVVLPEASTRPAEPGSA